MSYAYIASPYTHADAAVRQERFEAVCKYAANLMRAGQPVFSPIAHSHPIEQHFPEKQGFDFWMAQDLPVLRHATHVIVYKLPGWDQSKGIAKELAVARELNMQIVYVEPE